MAKTKAQISCAVTAQLISAFVFAAGIVKFIFYLYPNFKLLACFCDRTGRFVSDMVGAPNCGFSHSQAQLKSEDLLLMGKEKQLLL